MSPGWGTREKLRQWKFSQFTEKRMLILFIQRAVRIPIERLRSKARVRPRVDK